MRRTLAIMIVFLFASFYTFADGSKYKINDDAVNSMFTNAEETGSLDMFSIATEPNLNIPELQQADKNEWVAFALCFTTVVAVAGVHRLYLGTKTGVFIAYLCTFGGCGIVQTIDAIMLLIGAINKDIDRFKDNDKLFMFAK